MEHQRLDPLDKSLEREIRLARAPSALELGGVACPWLPSVLRVRSYTNKRLGTQLSGRASAWQMQSHGFDFPHSK